MRDGDFISRRLTCGNAVIAVQPDRGERHRRDAEYHDLRRAPRHAYVAFYLWLQAASASMR